LFLQETKLSIIFFIKLIIFHNQCPFQWLLITQWYFT